MEVNERHERAALLAILSGPDAWEFFSDAMGDITVADADRITAALHAAEDAFAPTNQAKTLQELGALIQTAVESYIRSCPAFESAVERAEQDDREAAADARYDAQRDDELTGHGRGK